MAIDYIRNIISSGYNLSKINDNFAKIQTALQDGLSRSGNGPNQMSADIDLNDNDLLNVKTLDVQNISYQGETLAPAGLISTGAMLKGQYDPNSVGQNVYDRKWSGDYNSEADFLSASIQPYVQFVTTAGYYTPGDAGGHTKKRITTPSPVKPWHKQSADGAWWELSETVVTPQMFGAKSDYNWTTNTGTDNTVAIQSAVSFGKKVVVPFGQYRVTDEIEIITVGQVIEFENTGGYAYSDNIGANWQHNTAFVATGTFAKRIRTRRLFRGSASDPQDAPLSVVLNIQAEGVILIRPCIRLYCDYSILTPSNMGDNCDVGIFIGSRVGVQIHDPIITDYFRVAGLYRDVSHATNLPRHLAKDGSTYPNTQNISGADGFHMYNPYIRGPWIGYASLGAKPKVGATTYGDPYYDQQLGTTVADQRGTFGDSDNEVFGGRIYGPDHHSNYRRADPVPSSGTLNTTSLTAEADLKPAAVHIDGMAGNASGGVWGISFFGTRIATFEAFRVRLGRASRVRFFGAHIEGRNGGRFNTSGVAIDTNDYTLNSYGDICGVATQTGNSTWYGAVRQTNTDGSFNHFYGENFRLDTDSSRIFTTSYITSAVGDLDLRGPAGSGVLLRYNGASSGLLVDANGVAAFGTVRIDPVGGYRLPSYTATQIASITDPVNTANKVAGKIIFDSTNNRVMVAAGTSAGASWRVCDNSASVTPV